MTNRMFINTSPLAIALFALTSMPALSVAAPTSGAYITDQTRSYVEDATSQGLRLPNTVLCYMNGTGANLTEVLNQGDYIALVDKNKCENSGGSGNSASGSSGASSAPSYMRAVVNGSRADNSSPLVGKVWFLEDEMNTGGGSSTTGIIYARLNAITAASSTSPYGVFHTDFCGKPTGSSTCSAFFGYAEGNGASVSAFQSESGGGGGGQNISMTLSGTTDSGSGRIKFSQGGQNGDWTFAYNSSYFRRYNNLLSSEQCFDRSFANADKTAWRYGVYNADGSRLERNGGFPIKVGNNYGYVGYWGLWLPSGVTLNDGDTVTRFSYGGSQASQADYTLVKKDGRLKKLTRNTTTLDGIKNVPFYYWTNGSNSEMKWDGTNLIITGTMSNNGTVTPLSPTQVFNPGSTWNISGWSQSLGGQLTIITRDNTGAFVAPSSASVVSYLTESVLSPGGAGWPASLYCINGCPATGATFINGLNGTGSPYLDITVDNFGGGTVNQSSQWNSNPVQVANILSYNADAATGLLGSGGNSVVWTSATSPSSQQFSNGFSSGRMVDSSGLASLQCNSTGGSGTTHYCPNRIDGVDTTYVWETGSNSWNKFSGLKNGGVYVSFDPPLPMAYSVPSSVPGFANANLILQYNGFGDLQGIPGKCINPVTNAEVPCANDNSTRWVAAFTIAEGASVTSDGITYYVKPLEQELRLSKVADSNCSSLTLPTILDAALPGISGWSDPSINGAVPVVTGAPRVIHGVVQY
jgi:hypothetical protein